MSQRTVSPTCPHCGYEFDEEETWLGNYSTTGNVHSGDGDDSDLVCPNLDCEKKFSVVCIHEIKFEAIEED